MGSDDDGDPPAGRTEEAEDTGDDRMDFEETTEKFIKEFGEKFSKFAPEGS
jgi:hypothetical protein